MSESTIPTAESLAEGIGEVEAPSKARYRRIRANGRTLAYASPRKEGLVLKVLATSMAGAPKRFQDAVEPKGKKVHLHVNGKNVKTARDLLAWLAKQD